MGRTNPSLHHSFIAWYRLSPRVGMCGGPGLNTWALHPVDWPGPAGHEHKNASRKKGQDTSHHRRHKLSGSKCKNPSGSTGGPLCGHAQSWHMLDK